jgi:hypothetical protein
MTRKNIKSGTAASVSRHAPLLLLVAVVSALALAGCQAEIDMDLNDLDLHKSTNDGNAVSEIQEQDSVLSLLGKPFSEIQEILGEPDEQGYGDWIGPHNYILYNSNKSFIYFSSPESEEKKIAVSILLGPGLGVLDARVGMSFQEIIGILGEPDLGPGPGMDNYYYADYFGGETNNGVPEIFISFVAYSKDSPTKYALVKWESYQYE